MEEDKKIEEELEEDPFIDLEFKEVANTSCEHEYIVDEKQDPNSELLSVRCVKCPSGCNINPDEFEIKKGKIVPKNS
jgi:hypothetical protein